MNKHSTKFLIAVANTYTGMKKHIQDEVMVDSDGNTSTRFRRAIIVLNEKILAHGYSGGFSLRDVYDEVLDMISVDLKAGYNFPVHSLEIFDHQARDWLLLKLEEYSNNEHPWRVKLRENSMSSIACCFCFGSMDGKSKDGTVKALGLLPGTYCQLIDHSTDEDKILEMEDWSLETDGVLIPPEFLKQFGHPDGMSDESSGL